MSTTSPGASAVHFFAAKPRDRRLAVQFLAEAGLDLRAHGSLEELLRAASSGDVGVIVLTEEGTREAEFEALRRLLDAQPPWSDLPVIVFVASKTSPMARRATELGGNVTTLERPVMSATLASTLRSALRSRRKQYELRDLFEGLQQATARLREQDRRKDEFLAMLGHELRNPLAAIHNALHLLHRTHAPESVERAHEIIDRQSRHLARLVDDLLDVSRVTLGRIQLVREPVDLKEIAARCVTSFQGAARDEGRRLRLDADDGPCVVNGDGIRLEQVLANLVGNALKFTPVGGEIVVWVRCEGDQAAVQVRDDGIGIDPVVLPHLFELFAQGAQPLDRHRGGLGLGLSLAKSLVERHGGIITAASEGIGRGSVFEVRLPLADARGVSLPRAPDEDQLRNLNHRVLVIEDNDDVRESLRMTLEVWGCQVFTARDGVEGLEKLLATRPDFAIVDIGLPRLDGYELARRARAAKLPADLKLIAITGYGQPEDSRRAVEAGFDVHLRKPVRGSDLAPWLARRSAGPGGDAVKEGLEKRSAGA